MEAVPAWASWLGWLATAPLHAWMRHCCSTHACMHACMHACSPCRKSLLDPSECMLAGTMTSRPPPTCNTTERRVQDLGPAADGGFGQRREAVAGHQRREGRLLLDCFGGGEMDGGCAGGGCWLPPPLQCMSCFCCGEMAASPHCHAIGVAVAGTARELCALYAHACARSGLIACTVAGVLYMDWTGAVSSRVLCLPAGAVSSRVLCLPAGAVSSRVLCLPAAESAEAAIAAGRYDAARPGREAAPRAHGGDHERLRRVSTCTLCSACLLQGPLAAGWPCCVSQTGGLQPYCI